MKRKENQTACSITVAGKRRYLHQIRIAGVAPQADFLDFGGNWLAWV